MNGIARELGGTVDRGDDVVWGEMMDHVAESRQDDQLTLGCLLMQPLGLAANIDDLIVPSGQDHHR